MGKLFGSFNAVSFWLCPILPFASGDPMCQKRIQSEPCHHENSNADQNCGV
jgi:hypothetical protein